MRSPDYKLTPHEHIQAARSESRDQLALWDDDVYDEDPDFLSRQLITCIGNKRSLLPQIARAVNTVKQRLGKSKLRVLDAFSGSGVVSRFLKAHSSYIASNDIEHYAATISRCYLSNQSTVDLDYISQTVTEINRKADSSELTQGFIEELYSPKDENNIMMEDRVFYTKKNARRLDNYRRIIGSYPPETQDMLLGPLLSKASIHTNTAGVFKGFYKDRNTKTGRFGGSGSDALFRIKGEIVLEVPLLSRFDCDYDVYNQDANIVVSYVSDMDLVYVDPPYNQHPYGSNYFMLNLIVDYERPERISRVSGIPKNWIRSGYNVRTKSFQLLMQLLSSVDARFLLISFNDEGFIPLTQMRTALERLGRVDIVEIHYNAFRGSRNLRRRPIHVTEHLFLVERR